MTTTPTRRLDTRALLPFVAVALPVGWVLLSIPLVADLPIEPFVLATLLLGLVAPALLLTRRDPATSIRALLHDCWRVPRPLVLLPALLVIPVTTWAVAGPNGSDVDGGVIAGLTVNIVSSVLIVNVWEEMAWAGFVQRRAALRWGVIGGAVATAAMFTGIHLPLAFYGADDTSDVLVNVAAMVVEGIGMRFLIAAFDHGGAEHPRPRRPARVVQRHRELPPRRRRLGPLRRDPRPRRRRRHHPVRPQPVPEELSR